MKIFLICLAIVSVNCDDIDWEALMKLNASELQIKTYENVVHIQSLLDVAIKRSEQQDLQLVAEVYNAISIFLKQIFIDQTIDEIRAENKSLQLGDYRELGVASIQLRGLVDAEVKKRANTTGHQTNRTDTEQHISQQITSAVNKTLTVLNHVIDKEISTNKPIWANVHRKIHEFLETGVKQIGSKLQNIKSSETRIKNLEQILEDAKLLEAIISLARGGSGPTTPSVFTQIKHKLTDLWTQIKSIF